MTGRASAESTPSRDRIATVLLDVLAYAREREYTGWDYSDGLSSAFVQALPVESKWLELAVQETVKRAPVNVRPLFLVERRRNFKGTGLFAMANLATHRLLDVGAIESARPDGVDYAAEATSLLDWLVANRSVGYSGFCGGHKHPIRDLDAKGYPNDPSIVSTAYPARALLSAATIDPAYADVATTAAEFVRTDLDYREVEDGAVIDYHVKDADDSYTINAGALGARLLLDLYEYTGRDEHLESATAILDHVAGLQTAAGGWYYREPPAASHLSMDTLHNGFVVECFQRYAEVADGRYDDVLSAGGDFLATTLFEDTGAPNWDESRRYPRDIHAAAQGILVFTYAGDLQFARRVIRWTLETLYGGGGQFHYRRERYYTKRTTLMRWCEAWMAYALAEHLRIGTGVADGTRGIPDGVPSRLHGRCRVPGDRTPSAER